MKLKDFSVNIRWDEFEISEFEPFFDPLYQSIFNWERKSGGYLLSPFPERITPYKESEYEVTPFKLSIKHSGLIYLEENQCLSLSLRQKHGKYPNLHPSGFLNNYQQNPNGKLLLPLNAYLSSLANFPVIVHSTIKGQIYGGPITFAQVTRLVQQALANPSIAISQPVSPRMKIKPPILPHGKLDYPIIGYRRFMIREYGNRVAIAPLNPGPAWKSKTYTKAICSFSFDHKAPDERCSCGLHAFSTLKGAIMYSYGGHIVASIIAFGHVIQHDDEGFRAEKARIIGFLDPHVSLTERRIAGLNSFMDEELPPDISLQLAEKYGVPLYYSTQAMEYAAKEFGDVLPSNSNNTNEPTFDE